MATRRITSRLPYFAFSLCGGLVSLRCAISAQAHDTPPPIAMAEEAPASEELELLKEEETVSIATRHEQPISQAPSNVYVITDEDIRHYEAGYQGWWMKHRLQTRLGLFFNHLSDLINLQTIGAPHTLINGGEADICGTEAGLEFLGTRWLSGFANISYEKIGQTITGVCRRGGYRFRNDKAEVAVAVLNAPNDRHKEHPLGDTLGSRVMGWLTLRY